MSMRKSLRTLESVWKMTVTNTTTAGDYFYVNGQKWTMTAGASSGFGIQVGGTAAATAANIVTAINGTAGLAYSCTSSLEGTVVTLFFMPRTHTDVIDSMSESSTHLGTPTRVSYFIIGTPGTINYYVPLCTYSEVYTIQIGGGSGDAWAASTVSLYHGSAHNSQEILHATAYGAAANVEVARSARFGLKYLTVCTTQPSIPYMRFDPGADAMSITVTVEGLGYGDPTFGGMSPANLNV